jgi:predicted RNA-binding Zn ribbon-like protein
VLLTSTQPGDRPPAPGELALVQAFINSHYDLEREHGADLFATPERVASWLHARGLMRADARLRPDDARRAVAVREGLRELARENRDGRRPGPDRLAQLNDAAQGALIEVRFGPDGPQLVPSRQARRPLDRALAAVLAAAAEALIDGTWARLKVCPGEDCGWAFYDYSRNQSGRWCSMAVCGGRAKARAHYWRRRSGT